MNGNLEIIAESDVNRQQVFIYSDFSSTLVSFNCWAAYINFFQEIKSLKI